MLARLFYSLYHAFDHRRCLSTVSTAKTICDININFLKNQGIKIIVLDFDGVLAAHGETFPQSDTEQWLIKCIAIFGKDQVFILSNNPFTERQRYFEELGVRFITGFKKKPYPDGLNFIISQTNENKEKIILIDDRLLTGILATCLAQTKGILIIEPYRNFSKHLIKESFFSFLRFIEKLFVKV
jgi:uncharacterized protein